MLKISCFSPSTLRSYVLIIMQLFNHIFMLRPQIAHFLKKRQNITYIIPYKTSAFNTSSFHKNAEKFAIFAKVILRCTPCLFLLTYYLAYFLPYCTKKESQNFHPETLILFEYSIILQLFQPEQLLISALGYGSFCCFRILRLRQLR